MRRNNHRMLRAVLRTLPDGATAPELAGMTGISVPAVHHSLAGMPDAYIDRWNRITHGRGGYSAVWCVVVPPPHCPKPRRS